MVLLIDNYDSFTYMLRDYILQVGAGCEVFRNDEINLDDIDIHKYSSIVISPGPRTPADAGITPSLISQYHSHIPILGICLGHQAIGIYFGGKLSHAQRPMHGMTSQITLEPHPIFTGIPARVEVMRYHSLILTDIPDTLDIIAQTDTGEVMAIAHQSLPIVGLQFHPESVLTGHGLEMIRNWIIQYTAIQNPCTSV